MVGGPAVADAVARAHQLPKLGVGLHLVLVDGFPVLPREEIPDLVRASGAFHTNMARAAARFFFLPQVRRQLAREIRAQFEVFRATGLPLDHVNTHKHFHLHPTVVGLIIEIGRDFGMKAVRLPSEPVRVLRRAFPREHRSEPLYTPWIEGLRRRLRHAGLFANDNTFGLAWSGNMVEMRLLRLIPHLPDGVNEIYLHPATKGGPAFTAAVQGYHYREELTALLSSSVKSRITELGIKLVNYSNFATLLTKT
jgi:hopanoid biosynthesis associated protein HpnK